MSTKVNYAEDEMDAPPSLAERRRKLKLSQQKVAELAGCSLAMVSLFERGYSPESSDVLDKVVAVLDEREREVA